jgi:hypothetical protein
MKLKIKTTMRVLMTLVALLCLSLSALASCENSTLVIHTNTGLPVKVYVDGMTGRNPATAGVTVDGVTPGRHLLKVVAVSTDYYGYTTRRTIYSGYINVRPSRHMDAWVEEGKGVSIHETRIPCGEEYNRGYESHDNRSYHSPSNNGSIAQDNPPVTTYAAPVNSGNLPAHISDDDFELLKNTIANTRYETKKMDTLKVLVGQNLFATSQVSVLMGLFAFDSNKLEVAKLLYDKTVDKQNYSRLASNFNFDARKEDFKKFMAGK